MTRRRFDLTQGGAAAERPDPAQARHTKIDVAAQAADTAPPAAAQPAPANAVALAAAQTSGPASAQAPSAAPSGPGSYQKRRVIHRGHKTTIWLASHAQRRDQWYALKQINPGYLNDTFLQTRFEQEATLASRLSHPHLAHFVEQGRDQEGPWLVMEYLPGPLDHTELDWPADLPPPPLSLSKYIDTRGVLPPSKAADVGMRLCSAVETMHLKRFLHGDIRPENILWDAPGQPTLVDYGLARPLDDPDQMLLPNSRNIDTYFASPEMSTDRLCRDPRADVYALAGTLIYALTKRYPVHCVPEYLPENLRAPLLRAIDRDPGQRFASAAALSEALARPGTPARVEPAAPVPPPAGNPAKSIRVLKRQPSAADDGVVTPPPGSTIRKIRKL